jgi:hypothetical protein
LIAIRCAAPPSRLRARAFGAADTRCPGNCIVGKDWADDLTEHPREVIELSLAHKFGNAVENAYRRRTMLSKRRALMDDWARFLATPWADYKRMVEEREREKREREVAGSNVVPFNKVA